MKKELKKVRLCFGKYGEKEERNCKGDCNYCEEKQTRQEVIFCEKKKTYPCNMICRDNMKCRDCYFGWFSENRQKYTKINEYIKKFMHNNKLIFEKKKEELR